jgi:hypothetical protein
MRDQKSKSETSDASCRNRPLSRITIRCWNSVFPEGGRLASHRIADTRTEQLILRRSLGTVPHAP